jgi:GGDEF domain-containing protein
MGILFNLDWHQTTFDFATVTTNLLGLAYMFASFFGLLFFAMAFFSWGNRKKKDDRAANSQRTLQSSIPSYQSTLPYMTFELTRARRYNHTLSVLIMGLEQAQKDELVAKNKGRSKQWGNEQLASKFLFSLIGSIIRESLRDSDILSYEVVNDRFIILLTDTDEKKARNAVERLNDLVQEQIQTRLKAGVAEFPSKGLTIEDLLKYAQTKYHHHPSKNGVFAVHRNENYQENDAPKLNEPVLAPATMGKGQ